MRPSLERGCVAETSRSGSAITEVLDTTESAGSFDALRLVEDDTAAIRGRSALTILHVAAGNRFARR